MKRLQKDDIISIAVMALLALPILYLSFFVEFERESGDNIVHYYFARYAPLEPIRYLDLWAKPVFTLLASPFAQLGFPGMKLFNGLAGWFSALLVLLAAKKLKLQNPWLAPVFLFFAPTYFILLFSGYTEPLFGLFLVLAFYLLLSKKYIPAAIVVSLMPFIRTEGVMFIVIAAAFLVWVKAWKSIPFLVVGPLVFSLAGWIAGKDIFWIITEIPYKVHSNYGSGTLTHYAEQWLLTVGVPLAISSVSGILLLSFHLLARKIKEFPKEYTLLLVLFLANFLFHTLTWYLGLFTAFGLIRIIIPLAPLGALFSLYAMGFLSQQKHIVFKLLTIAFLSFVIIFPFLHNPASFNFKKDFSQKPELLIMKEISQKVKQDYPAYHLYYSEPYFSHAMGINHFDLSLHNNFSEMPLEQIQSPALIIWDIWTSVSFAPYVHDFEHNPDFKLIHSYVNPKDSTEVLFRLYLKE